MSHLFSVNKQASLTGHAEIAGIDSTNPGSHSATIKYPTYKATQSLISATSTTMSHVSHVPTHPAELLFTAPSEVSIRINSKEGGYEECELPLSHSSRKEPKEPSMNQAIFLNQEEDKDAPKTFLTGLIDSFCGTVSSLALYFDEDDVSDAYRSQFTTSDRRTSRDLPELQDLQTIDTFDLLTRNDDLRPTNITSSSSLSLQEEATLNASPIFDEDIEDIDIFSRVPSLEIADDACDNSDLDSAITFDVIEHYGRHDDAKDVLDVFRSDSTGLPPNDLQEMFNSELEQAQDAIDKEDCKEILSHLFFVNILNNKFKTTHNHVLRPVLDKHHRSEVCQYTTRSI